MCLLLAFVGLAAYRVANVFDCFSNLPAGFAVAFFYLASGMIRAALSLEFVVIENSTNRLFRFSFCLIQFSFNLIFIR
jgi:hypothetical protein